MSLGDALFWDREYKLEPLRGELRKTLMAMLTVQPGMEMEHYLFSAVTRAIRDSKEEVTE